jgi:hypothetical protein
MTSSVSQKASTLTQAGILSLWVDLINAAHQRAENGGYYHGTISLLVIFHDRDQCAGQTQSRAIYGVHKPGPAPFLWVISDIGAPRLKITNI